MSRNFSRDTSLGVSLRGVAADFVTENNRDVIGSHELPCTSDCISGCTMPSLKSARRISRVAEGSLPRAELTVSALADLGTRCDPIDTALFDVLPLMNV